METDPCVCWKPVGQFPMGSDLNPRAVTAQHRCIRTEEISDQGNSRLAWLID
jgi:hypothetical protein